LNFVQLAHFVRLLLASLAGRFAPLVFASLIARFARLDTIKSKAPIKAKVKANKKPIKANKAFYYI
jgi:hypothetical protein